MAGIIEADQTSMIKAFKEKGLDGLKQMIMTNRNKWEEIPVRIAVTGNSGVGKSSFINAFRGLKPKSPGAAAVGVTETTMEVKAYPHPKNKNFVLYDLPGVGTKNFPRESYLQKVNFNQYDFFMILSATRFTENDAWLAEQVKKQKKKFFFVRTKIDFDMENEKEDNGDDFNQDLSLQKIKKDAEINLQDRNTKVYLITTKLNKIKLFDFDRLMADLIEATPTLKKESLVLFLPSLTETVILEKEKILRGRVFKMAIASGVGGAIPIPGFSALVDTSIIVSEAMFYKEQFGLDEISLHALTKQYSLNTDKLGLATPSIAITTDGVLQTFKSIMLSSGKNDIRYFIPILGSIICGVKSFEVTSELLHNLITTMKGDAVKIGVEIAKGMIEAM